MEIVRRLFAVGYSGIAVLFYCCALALIAFAALEFWRGVDPREGLALGGRFDAVLEAVGLLTIAVAALELGQTVLEEEVRREAHVSAPTRVRRFLSRFLIVVVVALSVETLVSVFRLAREDPSHLPQAATIGLAAAALLAAWGVFVRLNRSAEELEPEAMAQVKSEDRQVEREGRSRG
jgi:hypothetical protein